MRNVKANLSIIWQFVVDYSYSIRSPILGADEMETICPIDNGKARLIKYLKQTSWNFVATTYVKPVIKQLKTQLLQILELQTKWENIHDKKFQKLTQDWKKFRHLS